MRKDMFKVLVEDGRFNQATAKRKNRAKRRKSNNSAHFDEAPYRESMSRKDKDFNETLEPFARFLLSRVGCMWDEVYSEIREHLNTSSTVQMHILQHLGGYVDLSIKVSDSGVPVRCGDMYRYPGYRDDPQFVQGRGGWVRTFAYNAGDVALYVDDEGKLQRLPVRVRSKR